MDYAAFNERPIVIAIAGPNGAGKTTFYNVHLRQAALRFVNADFFSRALALNPYAGKAIRELPHVLVFDNEDLRTQFRQVALFQAGELIQLNEPVPDWLSPLLP